MCTCKGKDSNGECSSIKSESGSEKSVVFVGKYGEEEKHEKNSREVGNNSNSNNSNGGVKKFLVTE